MIKISIVGANGYTGLELLNILSVRGDVALGHLVSRSNAGQRVCSIYPHLFALKDKTFDNASAAEIAANSDVVFLALPHTASAQFASALFAANPKLKIIDLSADFRYRDVGLYERTYKVTHPCPELLSEAVYGLPEINRDEIKTAKLVGNPGCYTTSIIIPLYPLLKERVITLDNLIADSASGISGAGRKAETDYIFAEVDSNFKAYGITTHRHTSEIEEVLSLSTKQKVELSFTPHLLPLKRGILSTIYANLASGTTAKRIEQLYRDYYGNERFVNICGEGVYPELKHVVYGNTVSIGFKVDARLNRLIIISALDNLTKGASGQAVQNMNIICGLDEGTGLPAPKYI